MVELNSVCVIGIYVNDIEQAVEFYCEKLGFKEAKRYDDGCIVHLENDGPPIIIEKVKEPARIRYPDYSQIVLGIETEDIYSDFKRLKKLGVEFLHGAPQPFVAGLVMALRDPAGNTIELLQFNKE